MVGREITAKMRKVKGAVKVSRDGGVYGSGVYLSVVIPAYNEERRLPATLRRVLDYLVKQKYSWEVVVVNDGSKDRTAEVVRSFKGVRLVDYLPNRGKGHAVRTGMLAAIGQRRLICDADLSTPIEELEKFLPLAKQCQVLTGSRKLQESNVKLYQPWHRRLLGEFFSLIVKTLVVGGIHDTQCGFKLFSDEASNRIFSLCTINRWAWEPEVFYLAKKFGYGVREIPVVWVNDVESKVNPVRDSWRMLKDLLSTRWNIIVGRYVEKQGVDFTAQAMASKGDKGSSGGSGGSGGSCCERGG